MPNTRPLVLDVDGTFLKTDMLYECFWAGLGREPIATLKTAATGWNDRAQLKSDLAQIAEIRTDLLPVNPDVAALAATAVQEGRSVVLASASDVSQVSRLAQDYGFSKQVFASDAQTNLKGPAKAAALNATFGNAGYDYAGNEPTDMPIWADAAVPVVVGDSASANNLRGQGREIVEIANTWTGRDLIRALRPHQYVKNILLLLPMIAAHDFSLSTLFFVLLGIAAFSAAASTIYIVNDLLDLEADRLHPTKCNRPFASGAVPIKIGMITCGLLGLLALGLAALLGTAFLGVIVVYMILSLGYSLRLKRMRWVDIACLASLYTLRVVAGAAASGVEASAFMLVFIFPVFISLGCVKRLTELTLTTSDERLPGRGYGRPDRSDLVNVAGLGTFGALLIFFLYSFSEQASTLYPSQWLLWVALIPLGAWLIRMVKLGYEGKQDYDPIVFAMKDKMGIGLLLIVLSMMFYAAGLWQLWFGFWPAALDR